LWISGSEPSRWRNVRNHALRLRAHPQPSAAARVSRFRSGWP